MKTTVTQFDISEVLRDMCDVTHKHFDSYGYAAGYLGSVLESLMMELPVKRRKELLEKIREVSTKYSVE
jgi:hypothetical protein